MDLDIIKNEALKYKTRSEFKKNSHKYTIARRMGVLDTVCKHMKHGSLKWTKEALIEEALKYTSRLEFCKKKSGAYSAAQQMKILDEICKHMIRPERTVNDQASKLKWSIDIIKKEALKYNTPNEFCNGSRNLYKSASYQGILDEVCSHMTRIKHKKWTHDELLTEALKYKTRNEFSTKARHIYLAIQRRGMLDEMCKHMNLAVGGFDKNKPGYLYYAKLSKDNITLYKIGITNYDPHSRVIRYGLPAKYIDIIKDIYFESGREAYELEQKILFENSEFLDSGNILELKNGFTECFLKDIDLSGYNFKLKGKE